MKTMIELLKRLAELRPEWCMRPYKGDTRSSFYSRDGESLNKWSGYTNLGLDDARVQSMTQKAIDDDGLLWCRGREMVSVLTRSGMVVGQVIEFEYDSFTHALLAAYLNAITKNGQDK